jgi:hypothetical protein
LREKKSAGARLTKFVTVSDVENKRNRKTPTSSSTFESLVCNSKVTALIIKELCAYLSDSGMQVALTCMCGHERYPALV